LLLVAAVSYGGGTEPLAPDCTADEVAAAAYAANVSTTSDAAAAAAFDPPLLL